MTNSQIKKFLWQFGIYTAILVYLLGDLLVFDGPLSQMVRSKDPLSPENIAEAKARGVVAQVYNHSITRSQVERAARERLWRRAQDYDLLSEQEQRLARYAALNDLIDHELLRVKAMMRAKELVVAPEKLDARVERFKQRFSSDEARLKAMRSEGIGDDQALRDRIAAKMQQEAYVESKLAEPCKVTEEEARKWFEEHRDQFSRPAVRKLRHIFLPSLSVEKEAAMQQLGEAKLALTTGQSDFTTLALELSQDPATRDQGGQLGWVAKKRLPEDFAEAVWDLPQGRPTLVESSLGWHLVELMEARPEEARNFEQARDEVIAALQAVKREQVIEQFRSDLRKFEHHRITVFRDMME
ncbi:MAG: peptidyl-prolyl cis-trans isomerase [Akkermansiaceae bacterium]|nr:peptidyl-prolyl cis-trans isomerase [Akkermansiaceae bacterium]